ncbi:MAG: hypothetical protein GXP08_08300 [Gammaproteobacteria bacterium]|nr:hypothetical protein [Gammaproteobacteria bacterium]
MGIFSGQVTKFSWIHWTAILLMVGTLIGCGDDAFTGNGTTTSGGTTTDGGTTITDSGIQIGNGSGASFQLGTLSIADNTLSSGESTTVAVSLVDSDQALYSTSTSISFTSTCVSTGAASMTSPVATSGGIASTVYVAGCSGTDTITATAVVDGTTLTATGTVTVTQTTSGVQMGNGSGASFVLGALGVSTVSLSAGGSTNVTATLVDNAQALFATPTSVSFSSPCVASGVASITSPVTTSNGAAQSTYVATGCTGDDLITATATVDGAVLAATATITVQPASVGSIQFISATPEVIALAGTGGGGLQETSILIFKVVDDVGDPVSNQIVSFALDTNVGGITISPISGVTNTDGTVQTIVQSGNVHTPVKVTAATTDINSSIDFSTQSDALVISTGIADNDSFSLSVEQFLPEAAGFDGVTVEVTIRAADHFNNPVPDGTAISFTTEGGSIDGACLTTDGACSVTWTSQDPRPDLGRVTILATTIGSESFTDLNSNGVYDDGDSRGIDLAEAYRDDNESNSYDSATEEFLDFNLSGDYTAADGRYTGVLCQHSTDCSTATSLHVHEQAVIIMADSGFAITFNKATLDASAGFDTITMSIIGTNLGTYPPAGTTIVVSTTNGGIDGESSFTVADIVPGFDSVTNTNNPLVITVTVKSDGTPSSDGSLFVKVTTPKGIVSNSILIPVTD